MATKILEAKKILEQYAPAGEFLAYINKEESEILKSLGPLVLLLKKQVFPLSSYQDIYKTQQKITPNRQRVLIQYRLIPVNLPASNLLPVKIPYKRPLLI